MSTITHSATYRAATVRSDTLLNAATLAGRSGLVLLFVVSGVGKITDFARTAACMASKGMRTTGAQAQVTQFVKNLSMLGGLVIEASSPEPRRR